MNNWLDLPDDRKKTIFTQAAEALDISPEAVEKDFWVVCVLQALFATPIADRMVFKGGTSLSKCWSYLNRFSEDIDIALDRDMLGYRGELTKSQIKKLRRASNLYISTTLKDLLEQSLASMGMGRDTLQIIPDEIPNKETDVDPLRLTVFYDSVVARKGYLKDRIIIEVGSRSSLEPSDHRKVINMVTEAFPDSSFSMPPVWVRAISPSRTFLEKMILLHEEFSKPPEKIRSYRMSRHLYDIERLALTHHGRDAIMNLNLFNSIISHRRQFTPVQHIDYDTLHLSSLSFLPPDHLMAEWEADYNAMRSDFFYGESLAFDRLLKNLKTLKNELAGLMRR